MKENLAKNTPFNLVNNRLTLVVDGKPYQVSTDHPQISEIKRMILDVDDLGYTKDDLLAVLNNNISQEYFKIDSSVQTDESANKITVEGDEILLNGEIVHNSLADRIKDCMRAGLPFENMVKFMQNILLNPSYQSQKELFDFLSNKSLPITTDGCFLAYKAVRSDWMDKYSGTIYNGVGTTVKMNRPKVDDDRRNECSFGLHVGAIPYVQSYGSVGDKIVYVKVNPKDVVSVPLDYTAQKVRVCEYTVLEEYKGELDLSPVYQVNGTDVENVGRYDDIHDDGYDDDYDDDFEDDFEDEEDDYEPTYNDYWGWGDDDDYEEDKQEITKKINKRN
jgi:hypothetical protein